MDNYLTPQEDSRKNSIECKSTDQEPTNLKDKFAKFYNISNLFERQRNLIEASRQQTTYTPEEYCRLFEAYSQQRIRQMLTRRATQIIGGISSITIFIGFITFIGESAGREQKLKAEAWQVVTSNEKTIATAGRKEALEYLNSPSLRWYLTNFFKGNNFSSSDDRVILSGLEVPNAHLSLVKLPKAKLQGANFQGATLYGSDFSEANLYASNLSKTDLKQANLAEANLEKANLGGADLTEAKVENACLRKSNLRGTYLNSPDPKKIINTQGTDFTGAIYDSDTNIQGITKKPDELEQKKGMILIQEGGNLENKDLREVNLRGANLRNAKLTGADLEKADLDGADLTGSDINKANLFKVKNLTKEQVLSAKNWQTAYYGDDFKKILVADQKVLNHKNHQKFSFSGKKIQECPIKKLGKKGGKM